MRPLDSLSSIKTKLGVVIVGAVIVTVGAIFLGFRIGVAWYVSVSGAAILGLASVQFLARGMTSPLREMANAASAMATGDYTRRVTATSRDEVGQLAVAFNHMAADLQEVDRMRRDLIANVSHELRTPISALRVVLENLVDGVEKPDPETLASMLRQTERLGALVEQLLDLSRLESGVIPLELTTIDARDLLENATRDAKFHSQVATKDVHVDVAIDPPDLRLTVDAARVRQVLANLLDNAMRHSPDGGTIGVAARRDDGSVAIEVSDEGPGIKEEDTTRIFERFYRSDRVTNDGGSGLGLAIARWTVDLHGGDIRAMNRKPRGCSFVVRLPESG